MRAGTAAERGAPGIAGRVRRASSKPRRSISVSCLSFEGPVGAVSEPDAAAPAPSPNGGPEVPNGSDIPQGNGNGVPTPPAAPTRPSRPTPREEEPEPEPEVVPDPSGASESALLAALSMKDYARKQPKPTLVSQPARPQLKKTAAPAPSNDARRTFAKPATKARFSSQEAQALADNELEDRKLDLPTISPEVLSASIAPPKAPTRITSRPASTPRFTREEGLAKEGMDETPKDLHAPDSAPPPPSSLSAPPTVQPPIVAPSTASTGELKSAVSPNGSTRAERADPILKNEEEVAAEMAARAEASAPVNAAPTRTSSSSPSGAPVATTSGPPPAPAASAAPPVSPTPTAPPSNATYAPPTRADPNYDLPSPTPTPKRPSAVAAAAADPNYSPQVLGDLPDTTTTTTSASSTQPTEDFSLSDEVLLEPNNQEAPAAAPPLPVNESLAARPGGRRNVSSRVGTLPSTSVPQPQRGPENSPVPAPYTKQTSTPVVSLDEPRSKPPGPPSAGPPRAPRRPQAPQAPPSSSSVWDKGRQITDPSMNTRHEQDQDDYDFQPFHDDQEFAAMQQFADKAGEAEVDLEHPNQSPVAAAGAPAATAAVVAPPTMLTAPLRAPPPTKPVAPPSTGNQDEGGSNQGRGQRDGRGGGRGGRGGGQGRGQPGAQRQGQAPGRGRTLVNTQRDEGQGDGPGGYRRYGQGRGGGRGRGRPKDNGRAGAGGQRGSLTAANRRKARKEKKSLLAARREGDQRDREEIFEVPPEGLNVGELADLLAVNTAEVVKALFIKGVMAQVNQQLDLDTVRLAAAAFGAEAVAAGDVVDDAQGKRDEFMTEEDLEFLVPRPPVVCVMGHVDHGKTSLLDRIREASVAEGEAGGITQAIGAYNVRVVGSTVDEVCFLDTPGHEAFSAMRARGARVTDIAIIIVAADDGVRPQTLEAIAHARAAGVPMVVAINKIDKPGADVERVKGELAGEADLVPEQWGGTVPFVSISAKKDVGIDELLETVALLAEVEEFQANPHRAAEGTVLEAHLNRQVGPVATLLVQAGTLRKGDMVQAGASCGRVRKCSDSMGEAVGEALPSTAVSVIGLDAVPAAGDVFTVFENEADAHNAAELRNSAVKTASSTIQEAKEKERKARIVEMSSGSAVTLSTLATLDDEADSLQRMNLIVKADASGTLEAVKAALQALPQDSVALRFLLASTGPVQPSDIELARSSNALVIGFNTDVSDDAEARAKSLGVQVKTFDVIYALLDDVRARMEGRLKAVTEKVPCGKAEVKATFGKGKTIIGGSMVTEGKMVVSGVIEVRRNRKLVYEGDLSSLRRFKDEVAVVEEGVECGVGCTDFWEWQEGDKITCFELVQKTLTLEESHADRAVDGDLEEALAAAQAEYAEEEDRRKQEKEAAWRSQ